MLKVEKTVLPSPEQWEIIIEGMRNPLNSWGKSDSFVCHLDGDDDECEKCPKHHVNCDLMKYGEHLVVGANDLDLMKRLAKGGAVHAKYRRMIPVFVTLTAPLYWWKEFDTYKIGTVCNSCSTMHTIHKKPFTLEDFSHENLCNFWALNITIEELNRYRNMYLKEGSKCIWYSMIQLLPTSYNQRRTYMLNYEVLCNIYHSRKGHKLDEWKTVCDWIETLPYAKELIVGDAE